MNDAWDEIENIAKKNLLKKSKLTNSKIVLFGAGELGESAYRKITEDISIYALSDNNSELFGRHLEAYGNLLVISPEELKKEEDCFVIIIAAARHYKDIGKQLADMHVEYMTYMEYILGVEYDKFRKVYYEILRDDISRKVYITVLKSYLNAEISGFKEIFVRNQYFELPEFCMFSQDEVFVDCGAYVGETVEGFISNCAGVFNKVYAFEPAEKNKKAAEIRLNRLREEWGLGKEQLVIEQKLVGSKNEITCFWELEGINSPAGRMTRDREKNTRSIEEITLDSYFQEREEKPTFIKADVEGCELALLIGAAEITRKYRPKIAICIYHKIDDLYEIPLLIQKMNPEYQMEIRHHTPGYFETVLYCY